MRKRAYVSYLLFPQVFSRLLLVWICTAIASGALFLVAAMIVNQKAAQSALDAMQLNNTAFFSDARTLTLNNLPAEEFDALMAKRDSILHDLPGLISIKEQLTLVGYNSFQLLAYPSAFVEQASFLSKPELPLDAYDPPPVWLDSRMASTASVGETITLSLHMNGHSTPLTFTVVGFLDDLNTHLNIGNMGTTDIATAKDIIYHHSDATTAITIQEPLLHFKQLGARISAMKMLIFESGTDLSDWKQTIIGNGLGTIFTMDEMTQTESKRLALASMIFLALGAGLLLLTILGLGNVQYLLLRRCQHMAAVLRTGGMEWKHWQTSWLFLLGGLLVFPCILGCSIGILLQNKFYPDDPIVLWWLGIPIYLLILALTVISLYPLLSRWKHKSIVAVLYPSSQN